jgi:hypothetical protein
MPSKDGLSVGMNGVATKREILRAIGGLGLGTAVATTGSTAVAAEETDGKLVEEIDEKTEQQFLRQLRDSDEYNAVKGMITEGEFVPQFGKGDVYELVTEHERVDREGFVARVPTNNILNDGISVTIGAYAPSIDANSPEIRVTATKDGRELGTLYVDSETLKSEEEGYRDFFPATKPGAGGDLSTQGILPGWDDIREAAESVINSGQEIINGAADTFTETADYLQNELGDAVDEAYEQTEPLLDSVDLSPTPDKEPPAEVVDEMDKVGAEHVETIDLSRSCYYVGITLSIGAGVGVTMTGIGAGAGTLAIVGGGVLVTIAGCELLDLINTFKADSSCVFRYAYVFEEKDIYGNTENWYITAACE